jgi:hypothetical protein
MLREGFNHGFAQSDWGAAKAEGAKWCWVDELRKVFAYWAQR